MKKNPILSICLATLLIAAAASADQRVFVTSKMKADFGSLAGADQRCQDAAADAGLSGSWVAWLSDSATDAKDRIVGNGPFVLLSDQSIATDRYDLLDGELAVPIDVGPDGGSADPSPVWTGTEDNGQRSEFTCSDWTDTSQGARIGGLSISGWSGSDGKYTTYKCGWAARLYCFENDSLDDDGDEDGVLDSDDSCTATSSGEVVNEDGCSIADLCPCEHTVDGDQWKNHGSYVSCVTHTSSDFVDAGLVTNREKSGIVSAAGASDCGHR